MEKEMINLMKYKIAYLVFSALILVPGIVSLVIFGLRLSIDFTGGSVLKYQYDLTSTQPSSITSRIKDSLISLNVPFEVVSVDSSGIVTIRTKPIDTQMGDQIKKILESDSHKAKQLSFETVGPAIGSETTRNAFVALGWASLGILVYIAYAFRNVPKPYSSVRFGVSAIIAMLHDALVLLGLFSIFGHFLDIEIDALFMTALLTVLGFSVHDTIVVFDRIRENLLKLPRSLSFEEVTNYSLVETLNRSLATSLTVIITLFALLVLGGESIKTFVLAMLIGIVSGTYSSIFTASPILVLWEDLVQKRKLARKK